MCGRILEKEGKKDGRLGIRGCVATARVPTAFLAQFREKTRLVARNLTAGRGKKRADTAQSPGVMTKWLNPPFGSHVRAMSGSRRRCAPRWMPYPSSPSHGLVLGNLRTAIQPRGSWQVRGKDSAANKQRNASRRKVCTLYGLKHGSHFTPRQHPTVPPRCVPCSSLLQCRNDVQLVKTQVRE